MRLQLLNQHSNYIKETCSELEIISFQKRTLVSSFVKECKKKKQNEKLVIKESLHLRDDEKCIPGCRILENEYRIVSKLGHQNILQPISFEKQYKGGCALYFPRASCDAFQYFIERSQKANMILYSMKEVREMVRSIASALKYLHLGEKIAHNDIKLENILCFVSDKSSCSSEFVLTDFGFSYEVTLTDTKQDSTENSDNPQQDSHIDVFSQWKNRSRRYLSPEIIKSLNNQQMSMGCEIQSDIISLGFSLYTLVFFDQMIGHFETEYSTSKKYNRIQTERCNFLEKLKQTLVDTEPEKKDELFDLILKMIEKDPKDRIDICGVLNHPWLN